ncbi:extracellular matrix regulator RemB [Papillibacter cinnamivorans]|uniref:DUF370 domain-containing protein n=1 Tax=Papillibacter cinnamivorans DSM 12816 TaxID=1122930 RepID=A0A1W2A9I6_9FIRM|nr:DUF370 domain-containing protein [Papillibacter cinnamivorans]SMC57409.1 protein of unknown function [Papillibacter cinnamivorans DSM 12816]
MYLHLGQNRVVPMKSVIGLFDLDNTSCSHITRKFLERAEKEKKTVNVSEELPKSFAVCEEKGTVRVYISQLSTATLLKRTEAINRVRDD